MTNLAQRFTRFDRRFTLDLGNDMPPEQSDPTRCVDAVELQAVFSELLASSTDPDDMRRAVVVRGADIQGDYSAYGNGQRTPGSIIFSNCRFRRGFRINTWHLNGSLELSNVTLHGACSIEACNMTGTLTLKDIEAKSVTCDDVMSANLLCADVHLADELFFRKCSATVAALLTTHASHISILDTQFATFEIGQSKLRSERGLLLLRCPTGSVWLHDNEAATIRLANSQLQNLRLYNCAKRVRIDTCTVTDQFTFSAEPHVAELELREVKTEKDLYLLCEGFAAAAEISIYQCTIGRDLVFVGKQRQASGAQLRLQQTTVVGECRFDSPEITDLRLTKLTAGKLSLRQAALESAFLYQNKIAGDLDLHGLEIHAFFSLSDTSIGGLLSMIDMHPAPDANFSTILQDVTAGEVLLQDCGWAGQFVLHNCTGARRCRFINGRFPNLRIENMQLAGALSFSDCHLDRLAIRDGRAGSLRFAMTNDTVAWLPNSTLTLNDLRLGQLSFYSFNEEVTRLLPPHIDLRGCIYDDLPRFDGHEDPNARNDLCEILLSRGPYDPQPYTQLSKVLRTYGHVGAANQVQFNERQAARSYARTRGHLGTYLWLSLLRWTIGYGIGLRYFYAVIPALLFTLAGAAVLAISPQPTGLSDAQLWLWRLGASVDQLLPIIKLSPKYAMFFEERAGDVLGYWQNAYFTIHRLVGWLLGTFIIAGLSGLTQKPLGS